MHADLVKLIHIYLGFRLKKILSCVVIVKDKNQRPILYK